jgi:hypothetical protein
MHDDGFEANRMFLFSFEELIARSTQQVEFNPNQRQRQMELKRDLKMEKRMKEATLR